MSPSPYARIPQLDRLLRSPEGVSLLERYNRALVVEALRVTLEETRSRLAEGTQPSVETAALLADAETRLRRADRPRLRRVINATGVVLHTNLGRAVLAPAAVEAVALAASGHSNVEMDLDTGERGSRQSLVAGRLCRLTGAEAAAVFNNNAAAVFLALTALASGREVIVSRGELVEIGGAFRIPDIITSGGARLVEVGTTNRTRLDDYRRAITPETGLLLKVHPSNFRVVGFTENVSPGDLAALGREMGIPTMLDAGSGALTEAPMAGWEEEPGVREAVAGGLDLVTFSGDKLLGGPQAGIVVGKSAHVERLARHPLARALRCDKLTLAALEATLRIHEAGRAREEIPTYRYLSRTVEEIGPMVDRALASLLPPLHGEAMDGVSQVGGGSLPGQELPTRLLALRADGLSDTELARRLRANDPPIIGRTHNGRVLLDFRAVADDELPPVLAALEAIRDDLP